MIGISKISKGFSLSVDDQNKKNIFLLSHLKRNATKKSENNFEVINDNPQILQDMISFLDDLNLEHENDNQIQTILDNLQQQRITYQQNRNNALDMKQRNVDNIPAIRIPGFLPQHELTPFQNRVVRHGEIVQNVANFSIPGSGKTWTAYASYFLLKDKPEQNNVEKLLVICPKSAFKTWETEYQIITGENIQKFKRIVGTKEERIHIYERDTSHEIFLINYDTVRRDSELIQNFIRQNRFLVILDEAHHIKDPASETWMAISEFATFAFRRMILTGTPLPNKFADIWTQFEFLNPAQNILGEYGQFERRIQNPAEFTRIYEEINPYWMRIGLNDLDLEPVIPNYIHCPMGKDQTRIYRTIANDMLARGIPTFNEDRNSAVSDIDRHIMYLLEAATDPSLLQSENQYTNEVFDSEGVPLETILEDYWKYETPGKLIVLKEMIIQSMEQNPPEKLLIWCSFRKTIEKVQNIAQELGYNSDIIYGKIPQSDEDDPTNNKEKIIEDFKHKDDHNILIANPASLSESVSLHRECHHAIYVDRMYNAANWIQSKFRIWRYGLTQEQARDTKIDILFTRQTIDEDIKLNLENKERELMRMLNENNIQVGGLDIDYNNFTNMSHENLEMYGRVINRIREYLNDNV
ncbi:DEAD/DEAH box helicase [Nitrosopumilus sp.]|nr:DEAD/DEAH box helicase [Nitrosopumilus sp.]